MSGWALWMIGIGVGAYLLDRLLLVIEERGWINYRRHGASRGAAAYHALELQSIFDPSVKEVIEARWEERREQDESGDPPVPGADLAPPPPSDDDVR